MCSRLIIMLSAGLMSSNAVFADTVEDCINAYKSIKRMYDDTSVSASQLSCTGKGNSIRLYATATPPSSCIDEDEWHLEARAVGGGEGSCSVRLIGSPGIGCGADKVEHTLNEKDAIKWMKFIDGECGK